jgi:hypothetical protein
MAAYESSRATETGEWRRVLRLQRLRGLLDLVRQRVLQPAPEASAQLDLFGRVLGRAAQVATDHGAELIFVYLPSRLGDPPEQRAAVLARARELGLEVVDLQLAMEAHPDPLALSPNRSGAGHLSEAGYELVAGLLREVLARRLGN